MYLTLSRRRPLSYRNQSIDLLRKSMDWFLYDNVLRLERVKALAMFLIRRNNNNNMNNNNKKKHELMQVT